MFSDIIICSLQQIANKVWAPYKDILDILLAFLIDECGMTVHIDDFFDENDDKSVFGVVVTKNVRHILKEQNRYIMKICAKVCAERIMCKLIEDNLFCQGPSIFSFLKTIQYYKKPTVI